MGLRTLKNLIRPLSTLISPNFFNQSSQIVPRNLIQSPKQQQNYILPRFHQIISHSIHLESLTSPAAKPFDPLTDARFPKRRPSLTSSRKPASIRPNGEPIAPSQPNAGSVKLRNEKKRCRQHREFVKRRYAMLLEAMVRVPGQVRAYSAIPSTYHYKMVWELAKTALILDPKPRTSKRAWTGSTAVYLIHGWWTAGKSKWPLLQGMWVSSTKNTEKFWLEKARRPAYSPHGPGLGLQKWPAKKARPGPAHDQL